MNDVIELGADFHLEDAIEAPPTHEVADDLESRIALLREEFSLDAD